MREKVIEDYIYSHLEEGELGLTYLDVLGFPVPKLHDYTIHRQCKLGEYGIADIIIVDKYKSMGKNMAKFYIYELKAKPIRSRDVDQVCRYATGVEFIINNMLHELAEQVDDYRIRMILIGDDVAHGHYAYKYIGNLSTYGWDYDNDDFHFYEVSDDPRNKQEYLVSEYDIIYEDR